MKSMTYLFRRLFFRALVLSALLFSNEVALAQGKPPVQPTFEVDEGGKALSDAFHAYRNGLHVFATEYPEGLGEILDQAFGEKLSDSVREEMVQQAIARTLPVPERIIFVEDSVLADASAAYHSENGGTIFIGKRYRYDFESLTELIAEECGHHIDHCLGGEDAEGDEGAIFQQGLFDAEPLVDDLLAEILAEDDHTQIIYEGETFDVELGKKKRKARRAKRQEKKAVKKEKRAEKKVVRKEKRQARNKKIREGFKSVGNAVVGAVVGVAEATYNTVIATGKGLADTVISAGQTIGNFSEGMVLATRSAAASLNGDFEKADRLNEKSETSFDKSKEASKRLGTSVLDVITAPGNGYNQAVAAINENIPFLGTILDIGLGFTPLGPYIAGVKGVADIRTAIQNNPENPLKAGLTAGAYVAIDVGGPGAGKYFGKLGKAKDTVKYWDDVARIGTRGRRAQGGALGARPGLASRGFNMAKGAANYGNLYEKGSKVTGFIVKGLIPGRTRGEGDALLGQGGSKFGVGKSFLVPENRLPRPSAPPGGKIDFVSWDPDYIAGIQLGVGGAFNGPFIEGPEEIFKRVETVKKPTRASAPPAPPVVTAPPVATPPPVVVTPPPTGGTGGGMP